MRGIIPVVVTAALLALAAPATASHEKLLEDGEGIEVDLSELLRYDAFEFLLLPGSLQDQLGASMGAELPGPNDPLSPDLNLVLEAPGTLSLPSVDGLPTLATATPTTASATTEDAPETGVPTTSTSSGPTASSGDAVLSQASDEGTASATTTAAPETTAHDAETQSASASGPSNPVSEAWASLSPAQQAATAGLAALLFLLGPMAMYSRITRDETLENDTRRGIYELVEAQPGLCIKEIAEEVDVSYSTASYHLDRLVKTDYLVQNDEGNKVLYYKNGGTFSKDERQLVPILKNPECMAVFEHILEHPWCYRAEVAKALEVSHTTVNWHLKRLQEAGLVDEHREGRNCHLYVHDESLDRVVSVFDKLEAMGVGDVAFQQDPIPA